MADIKQARLQENEQIRADDSAALGDLAVASLGALMHEALAGTDKGVVLEGLQVFADEAPSSYINISPGDALLAGQILTLSEESLAPLEAMRLAVDLDGQARIDIVEARFIWQPYDYQTRKFIDPQTQEVTVQNVAVKKRACIQASVKRGAQGRAPALSEGALKLAEIHIQAGDTAISAGNIKNISALGEEQANEHWNADQESVFYLGRFSRLKSRLNALADDAGSLLDKTVQARHLDYGAAVHQVNALQLPLGQSLSAPALNQTIAADASAYEALRQLALGLNNGSANADLLWAKHSFALDQGRFENALYCPYGQTLYMGFKPAGIQEFFARNGWQSFADKESAGCSRYFAPAGQPALYETEVFDAGELLAGAGARLQLESRSIGGASDCTATLCLSEDGLLWQSFAGQTAVLGQKFRYVKAKLEMAGQPDALLAVSHLSLRVYKENVFETGRLAVSALDEEGTQAALKRAYTKAVVFVSSLGMDEKIARVLHDFDRDPYPSALRVKLLDESGARLSGTVCYMVMES